MSRQESDREDLLREATALVERVELQIRGYSEPVVVGFRRDGAASFFFGADPVYQFNADQELRRAFVGGLLFKAEDGRLVELRRERKAESVELNRRDLSTDEETEFLSALLAHMQRLHLAFQKAEWNVQRQAPEDKDLSGRIRQWLESLPSETKVARRPNVGKTRR